MVVLGWVPDGCWLVRDVLLDATVHSVESDTRAKEGNGVDEHSTEK
jgi:hypothetical protein